MGNSEYIISTDKSKLEIPLIHDYLSNHSYWAQGRSIEMVEQSIANSFCIGAYDLHGGQVGFGRVVTDYAVFGWILDLFVLDEYQGEGIGKMLMDYIMRYPQFSKLQRWGLNTNDAHGLYEKYGFQTIENPDFHMEIRERIPVEQELVL